MACASSSSVASRYTKSSSWSPQSAIDLSLDQQIDDQLEKFKDQSYIVLDQYDLIGNSVDVETAIKSPPIDLNVTLASQFGRALLANGKNQTPHCTDDLERVLVELNIDTHTVINSSRKEFIEALMRLVSLTIRQQTHTLVLVAYSGEGNELELHFSDGNLRIEHILDFLLFVPARAPLVLIFDCICVKVQDEFVKSVKAPLSHALKLKNRGYIFHLATRSKFNEASIFDDLSRGLSLGENLGSIISCGCATAITVSTQLAAGINLLSMHSNEPGSPACDCRRCTIFSLCNGECTEPSKKRLVRVLPGGTSLPCNSVRCQQPRTRQIIGEVNDLLKVEFFHKLLDGADHHSLIFRARAYFSGFKMSEGDISSETAAVIDRLYQYIADKALWISVRHLERLRKLAISVDVPEAISAVDRIEDLVMELTSAERVVHSGQMVSYPPCCQYTSLEHVVYIVDEAFDLLPISVFHQLYCRVQKNLCKAKGDLFFLSFASCSTALHKGLI